MRVTRHNGRSSDNSARHNDRDFNYRNSRHIDDDRTTANVYWDCYQGFRDGTTGNGRSYEVTSITNTSATDTSPCDLSAVFSDVEMAYYHEHYQNYCDGQNGRNNKARHSERNKSPMDILKGGRTQPEESIFQIGSIDGTVSPDELLETMKDFMSWFETSFGTNIHVIDWSLHADETTPHIHERHVFDYRNEYGELQPMQEGALEKLGIERPDPKRPKSRTNNRKTAFDDICRKKWIDICREHGLDIECEPVTGRKHMEKNDFIIEDQKKRIEEKAGELDTLEMKISDIDTLIRKANDVTYEKMADEVSHAAAAVVKNRFTKVTSGYASDLTSPGSRHPEKSWPFIRKLLAGLTERFSALESKISGLIKKALMLPEVETRIKEAANKKAKVSIIAFIKQAKIDAEITENNRQQETDQDHGRSHDNSCL